MKWIWMELPRQIHVTRGVWKRYFQLPPKKRFYLLKKEGWVMMEERQTVTLFHVPKSSADKFFAA